MPDARLGEPQMKDKFDLHFVNGIKVYIIKALIPADNIHIGLRSFLLFKTIDITGFRVM